MSNDPSPVVQKRSSNTALIISLCFNLIFIGVIAVGVVRAQLPRPMMAMQSQGPYAPRALMRFAPAEADKIQHILDLHREKVIVLRAEAFKARRELLDTFASGDFNTAAFSQALDRVRTADAALEAEEVNVLAESVATLTPAERRDIAERVRTHRAPWWVRLMRQMH